MAFTSTAPGPQEAVQEPGVMRTLWLQGRRACLWGEPPTL